ncbi:hypothetical protein N7466_005743 [Penicillium verhagenii]|uniref:uncharacterized protein n=1 Tax=Penicillium verhagenii TaxID=1562060 RepID=UPI0025453AC4|nr:uncharacterized protein N7466_005743 [Penicillium verhagenii]KAJ5930250.1 hypothetical protein N7466_005743 [Penicillium verhagenii]
MTPPRRRLAAIRACDPCRRRKVKCDALEICANCRTSGLACHYTTLPKKRGPKSAQRPSSERWNAAPVLDNNLLDSLWGNPSPAGNTAISPPGEQGDMPLSQLAGIEETSAALSAQNIRDRLLRSMSSVAPSSVPLNIVDRCIHLYMQYTFPTAPIVHEPTLREYATTFFSGASTRLFAALTTEEEVAHMRAFALLSGLCASVASVIPISLLPYRHLIAKPCLDASREMLRLFEDYDVENPNSSSIVTRIFHTTALQNITGKTRLTYHILGQAALFITNMRLYREDVLQSHDPLEGQLLRHIYWQIYAADQASLCLRSRPFHLHQLLYNEESTICPPGRKPVVPQFDTTTGWYDVVFEERMLLSFHLIPRLWSTAAALVSDMRKCKREVSDAEKSRFSQAYMEFLGIMDDLPYWLQASHLIFSPNDGDAVQFHKTAFWVQRCTIQVSFQCLRLVILQQCIGSELCDIMGLNNQPVTFQMTKIGMIQDVVQTLDDIPFVFLLVKGEPTVERIRLVGSILLEVLDQVEDGHIRVRANHLFTRLLDILSRFDSKSSDVLVEMRQLGEKTAESRRDETPK